MIKQLFFSASLLLPISEANTAWVSTDNEYLINSEWELNRNSDGVKTYTRWIAVDGSQKVRERKGEAVMNCAVDDVIRLLCDSKSTKNWMSGIKENYCLKQISLSEWYTYTLFDIPWPFEQRDLISNFRVSSMDEGKKATILISSREDYLPEKPSIKRLTNYTGTWTIVRLTDEKVFVSFSAIANMPPMFPRFVQDPVLIQMFHNNLVKLKKLLDS
jgi:hypothetical protein